MTIGIVYCIVVLTTGMVSAMHLYSSSKYLVISGFLMLLFVIISCLEMLFVSQLF